MDAGSDRNYLVPASSVRPRPSYFVVEPIQRSSCIIIQRKLNENFRFTSTGINASQWMNHLERQVTSVSHFLNFSISIFIATAILKLKPHWRHEDDCSDSVAMENFKFGGEQRKLKQETWTIATSSLETGYILVIREGDRQRQTDGFFAVSSEFIHERHWLTVYEAGPVL